MLRHLSRTQAAIAKAAKPLPTQRELLEPDTATGGSGQPAKP